MSKELNKLSPDILSEIFKHVSSYPVAKRVSKEIEKMYTEYSESFITKEILMKKYPGTFTIPIDSLYGVLKLDFNVACVNGDFEAIEALMNIAIDRISKDHSYLINDVNKRNETIVVIELAIEFLHFFGKKKHTSHIVDNNKDLLLNLNPKLKSTYLINRYLYPDLFVEPKDTELRSMLGYANYPSEIKKMYSYVLGSKPIYVDISTYRNIIDEICVNKSIGDNLEPIRAIDMIKDNHKEETFIYQIAMEDVITNNMIEATKELSLHYGARTGKKLRLGTLNPFISQYFITFVAPGLIEIGQ